MNRRNKIILIVAIILMILLALLLFWYRFLREPVIPGAVVITESPAAEQTTLPEPNIGTPPNIPVRTTQEVSVETLTLTFTERYGSYSNEAEFQNLLDLEPLVTNRFMSEIRAMIASLQVEDYYRAITTRVISMNITELDETTGVATVSVTTQRKEAIGSPMNSEVRYETLLLEIVKQGGVWLVDDATWQ
ncbi:MAG: hypothetical protein ABIG32_03270 [Candidatus Uhrbacteria bacterium]|nr:hypothetical protein [Patescibacteria group bacterium]MBU1906927.1 hypothetical protein [Patescibacteria group bacterium]